MRTSNFGFTIGVRDRCHIFFSIQGDFMYQTAQVDVISSQVSLIYENNEIWNHLLWILINLLIIRYSPEQLFNVVAAVDMYEDFLPWCQRSEIVRRNPDGNFDAELEIGFKFFVESYISHVELKKPSYIKVSIHFYSRQLSHLLLFSVPYFVH